MLMPKRTKHRKMFKGRMTGWPIAARPSPSANTACRHLSRPGFRRRQIEAARRAITNYLKRGGKVWIRIFPDKPVTQKPAETRMGPARATRSTGLPLSSRAVSCSRSPACRARAREEALRRAAMKMPMDAGSSSADRRGRCAAARRSSCISMSTTSSLGTRPRRKRRPRKRRGRGVRRRQVEDDDRSREGGVMKPAEIRAE